MKQGIDRDNDSNYTESLRSARSLESTQEAHSSHGFGESPGERLQGRDSLRVESLSTSKCNIGGQKRRALYKAGIISSPSPVLPNSCDCPNCTATDGNFHVCSDLADGGFTPGFGNGLGYGRRYRRVEIPESDHDTGRLARIYGLDNYYAESDEERTDASGDTYRVAVDLSKPPAVESVPVEISPTEALTLIKAKVGAPMLDRMLKTLRKGRNNDHEARDKLSNLFVQLHAHGLTDAGIARLFGCRRETVWKRRAKCNTQPLSFRGAEVRVQGERQKLPDSSFSIARKLSVAERKHLNKALRRMGYSKGQYQKFLNSHEYRAFNTTWRVGHPDARCLVCGSRFFDLHHLTYKYLDKLRPEDVAPLCRFHHNQLHERALDLRKGIDKLRREFMLEQQLAELKRQGMEQYEDIRAKLDELIDLSGGDPVKTAERILAAEQHEHQGCSDAPESFALGPFQDERFTPTNG